MFTAETFGVEEWHYFDEAVLFVGAWGNEGGFEEKRSGCSGEGRGCGQVCEVIRGALGDFDGSFIGDGFFFCCVM